MTTTPITGGRGLKPFRILLSDSGSDDFTFDAPSPAKFAGLIREENQGPLGAQRALLLLLDCAEGAPPVKKTVVFVRFGRVWHPKAGFRLELLGTYVDPNTGSIGAVYESIPDPNANASSLS